MSDETIITSQLLAGRRAIVMGGADSTGLVMARTLVRNGAQVHIGDVNESALSAATAAGGITGTVTDVGRSADVARLFQEARMQIGPIEILVNVVGIPGPNAPVEEINDNEFSQTFAVNVQGTFSAIREAVPDMKLAGGGVIINFSSSSTRTNMPNRLPYVASKWAVEGMTRALARELGPYGIRVNALLPGMIDNTRMQKIIETNAMRMNVTSIELKKEYLRYVSTRSSISPQELAETVVFLSSDSARNITGQLIGVDGNIEWEV